LYLSLNEDRLTISLFILISLHIQLNIIKETLIVNINSTIGFLLIKVVDVNAIIRC